MDDDARGPAAPTVLLMINGWQPTLMIGVVTLVLGVIVTTHPNGSLQRDRGAASASSRSFRGSSS